MSAEKRPKRYEAISRDTLRVWEAELQRPTEPAAFRSRVDEIHKGIGGKTFFNQPSVQFLRDAWIGARVATAMGAEHVRVWEGNQPDFEVVVGGQALLFEATEADKPGRKRGDEYLQNEQKMEPDPASEWRKRFEIIPAAVETAVSKKLGKHALYPAGTNLIVLVNLGCYRAYLREGIPLLYRHTSLAKNAFKGVYVLWEGSLYHCWDDGRPADRFWSTRDEELPDDSWSEVQESIWKEVVS
jgi:hypothetical protein